MSFGSRNEPMKTGKKLETRNSIVLLFGPTTTAFFSSPTSIGRRFDKPVRAWNGKARTKPIRSAFPQLLIRAIRGPEVGNTWILFIRSNERYRISIQFQIWGLPTSNNSRGSAPSV